MPDYEFAPSSPAYIERMSGAKLPELDLPRGIPRGPITEELVRLCNAEGYAKDVARILFAAAFGQKELLKYRTKEGKLAVLKPNPRFLQIVLDRVDGPVDRRPETSALQDLGVPRFRDILLRGIDAVIGGQVAIGSVQAVEQVAEIYDVTPPTEEFVEGCEAEDDQGAG